MRQAETPVKEMLKNLKNFKKALNFNERKKSTSIVFSVLEFKQYG
jgi:hypothetical protein